MGDESGWGFRGVWKGSRGMRIRRPVVRVFYPVTSRSCPYSFVLSIVQDEAALRRHAPGPLEVDPRTHSTRRRPVSVQVTGISWDDGCYLCSSSQCQQNTYEYSGELITGNGAGESCYWPDSECLQVKQEQENC